MKKLSLLWLALAMAVGVAYAAPVDVNLAKTLGQKYVQNTLGNKTASLSLAYTEISAAGTDALYIFNFDHGYVVVAADDHACPILGYSEDAPFDVENIPEGLRYYLGYYARQIQFAIDHDLPTEVAIADQWYLLGKEGVTMKNRMSKSVSPLLATTWNQDYPYNYYAPTAYGGPGGHCYAGCVATAMSQVMKYWNWPETGVGSHSYSTSTYGGTLSVNFGETTYDWANMPNSVVSANAQGLAVALLMYHCGIAVDMDYDPSGSGANTADAVDAVINHFRYGACTKLEYRDEYTKTQWEDLLIAQLDKGLPMVYAGTDSNGSGGHAFNCDGYNDQRKFHFNWGWSGQGNNTYYEIDALNVPAYLGGYHFNLYQRTITNMIPDYIYNALVPTFNSFDIVVADAVTSTAVVRGTVPTVSVTGADLESVQRVIVKRNGEVLQVLENVLPGEEFSFVDEVSEYGCYEYSVCGVNNDFEGEWCSKVAVFGLNCTWKLIGSTTNFQGWNGGSVQVVGANGVVVEEVSLINSSPVSEKFQMPEGSFTLRWNAPATAVSTMTISLKNSANQQVYNFSGSSSQLTETLYTGDNDCDGCTAPTNLTGEYYYNEGVFGTRLTWDCDYEPSNFKIYRSQDGDEYTEIAMIANTEHEYLDEVGVGSYLYKVTAFSTACESTPALTPELTDYVFVNVTAVEEQGINVMIYPNPAKDALSVQASNISEVVLFNILGQPVYRHQGLTNSLEINTSNIESGIYTMSITTADGMMVRRVMVLH